MPSGLTRDVFQKMDEKWGDQMEKLFGLTLLGYPEDTDSSRQNMLTSNLKQILSLEHPDVAHVQTHYEYIIGKYNRVYKKMLGEWEVKDVISKFQIPDRTTDVYTMILYNKEKDLYDVVEKSCAENQSEKFGYSYDNSKMDSLNVGDTIKDEMLFKTPSYDEFGNYRLGKNALVAYTSDTATIEDAIKIRKGWADQCVFTEVDNITASINTNDVLINIYGDDKHFKAIPEIGECVKGTTLCAVRRISSNRILFDFQAKNIQTPYSTDTEYCTSMNAMLYDLDILYNGEDPFPDTVFFRQLKSYYDKICVYADKVTEWCKRIKESGSKYTKNVTFLKSKYQLYNNKEYSWNYKSKAFTNMVVIFRTKASVSIHEGYKLVGRYGDKGVVSKYIPDVSEKDMNRFKTTILDSLGGEELTENERQALAQTIEFVDDASMPYMEDGTPIDIELNGSGSIRRLNTGQNIEVELNFQGESVRRKMLTLDTLEEKAELAFRFLELINQDEKDFFFTMYNNFTMGPKDKNEFDRYPVDTKKGFIDSIERNGFYIIKRPHAKIRYDTIAAVYDEFPWIKPFQLYINIFGMIGKPVVQPMVVGSKYMYLLKQTSNKNYSARSTGRVNKKGLPAKSNDKRDNLIPTSNTPIKIGEAHNLFSAISGTDFLLYTLYMRGSPVARKSLKKIVETEGNPLEIKSLKIRPSYRNLNAIIFKNYMKGWGIGINFVTDNPQIQDIIMESVQPLNIEGTIIYDIPQNKPIYHYLVSEYYKIAERDIFVESEPGEKKRIIWDEIFNRPEVKDMKIPKGIKEMLLEAVDPDLIEVEKPRRRARKSTTPTNNAKLPVKPVDTTDDTDDN